MIGLASVWRPSWARSDPSCHWGVTTRQRNLTFREKVASWHARLQCDRGGSPSNHGHHVLRPGSCAPGWRGSSQSPLRTCWMTGIATPRGVGGDGPPVAEVGCRPDLSGVRRQDARILENSPSWRTPLTHEGGWVIWSAMESMYSARGMLAGWREPSQSGLLWNGVRYLTLGLAAPLP